MKWVALAAATVVAAPAAGAQAVPGGSPVDSSSPFGPAVLPADAGAQVAMPELAFTPTPENIENYDKYYVFHRDGADLASAYADIRECDGYASGLRSGIGYMQPAYPYAGTMAGAVGGAVGNALAAAIFGSAEKRRLRRVNMRTCMNFKGYARYGISKDRWKAFNFEEGFSGVPQEERERLLRQQAMVASSAARPTGEDLGL